MREFEPVVDGLVFTECPRWHDERVWYSDTHVGEVHRFDPATGDDQIVARHSSSVGGLGFLPDGRLLAVSSMARKVLRLEAGGFVEHADMGAVVGPWPCNDMAVDARGRAYVGGFGYDIFGGAPMVPTHLVLVTPDGSVRAVGDHVTFPNGAIIAPPGVTPDGATLIVAETMSEQLVAFTITDDGSLVDRRVYAHVDGLVPDGICLDAEGAVWVAHPRGCGARDAGRSGDGPDRAPRPQHLRLRARWRRPPHAVRVHRHHPRPGGSRTHPIGQTRSRHRRRPWSRSPMSATPLAGVRILAVEQQQALPFATQLFARMGAEVIKVEHPEIGESGRTSIPAMTARDGRVVGATYLRNNLGKRSIGIDLKHPQGRDLFLRLAREVDVVGENFKAGTMDRLGLGYADVAAVAPQAVYVSVSGFGNVLPSPYRDWPAYAAMAESMAGFYERNRRDGERPAAAPPVRSATSAPRCSRPSACSPRSASATAPARASSSTCRCSTR